MDRNILNGKRILVVEDDHMIAVDLLQGLENLGAEVVGPFSGTDEALGTLRSGTTLQGGVLDVAVRGETVFRLADELVKRGVPIVFATAADASEIPPRFRNVARFSKPYDVNSLARTFSAD